MAAFFLFGGHALYAQNAQAVQLLNQGRVDEASSLLNGTLEKQPNNAQAHQLLCRVEYAQDQGDNAVHECELAVQDDPSNAINQVWLGRAYGLKASQANMLSAFGIAKKVHTAFEHALEIDPTNVEAMSDLGQFYVAAPGIVGGGVDRARGLVDRLMDRSAARGHRLLGQIAAKKNDLSTAENEFKAAVAAGKTPEAWVDLGLFYQTHGQADKAVVALQSSIEANHQKNAALVDAASILTDLHQRPDLAEKCLRDYLASPAKTELAPAFKVHLQLGDLLKQRGDLPGAKHEYAAALAMASKFAPAIKAQQGA
ncbi:MAG: tetratricopeptide repeat protein [Edaphobacter sp.]|uniref:tetratricopeptide repeat protein n=1 Tax=Edaphobacter sp. TaxID=1934404 RepID=UPI002392D298|nr:tetratricopeptide repeat protein [Edaphobacter sp.]MDE1176293.1 tetratricopeptide repeat protein [Edaphobacter sp.]